MARPIYETETNRQHQLAVGDTMAPIRRSRLVRTRYLSSVDYIVESIDGVLTGLMEVKVRNYTPERMDEMGGFFRSERKLLLIHQAAKSLKADFHLVVKTPNCLLHLCFEDGIAWPRLERTFGGRFDRNDSKDAETLCLFPTTMFTRIENDPAPVPARSA